MNTERYKGLLYFIIAVIAVTLGIQVYWNYKNYQTSKQQFINDVQTSLDNAVDQYYTDLAAETSFEFIGDEMHFIGSSEVRRDTLLLDTLVKGMQKEKGITIVKSQFKDSLGIDINFPDSLPYGAKFFQYKDSLINPVETLSSKIIVSFAEDSPTLETIDSLFSAELDRKNIAIEYGLTDKGILGNEDVLRPEVVASAELETSSKSPYFFHGNELKAHFSNVTFAVLKRNLFGISLSFVLVACVIGMLFYLLQIIKKQKQLAELKNDLISNITHEFKTPLATMGVALEGIQNFNKAQDTEKTQRYTKISQEQVEKLNLMVEKLLETATLDSDRLELQKESVDLAQLLDRMVCSESVLEQEKSVDFHCGLEQLNYSIDPFHFENALNNILDNALKYGGDTIEVSLRKTVAQVEINIKDSGSTLSEAQAKMVFDKFYRVPKGNTHDVKGFGIGLYYTKKIIEKHNGTISVSVKPTTFKITLPV